MLLMANALIPALLVGTTAILLVTSPSYAFSVAKGGAQGAKGARSQPSRRPRKAPPAKNALPGKRAPKTQEASAPREGSKTAQAPAEERSHFGRDHGQNGLAKAHRQGTPQRAAQRAGRWRCAPQGTNSILPSAFSHLCFMQHYATEAMQQKPRAGRPLAPRVR